MALQVPGRGRTVPLGQAQPQSDPFATATAYSPSVGTQNSAAAMQAYRPGGQTVNQGMNQQQRNQAFSAWAMPKQDLLAWGQSQPQTQPLAPQPGMSPDQTWNTISGVINQVNNTAANQQVGTYLGQGAPPAGWGQTNYNPQQMWSQANQMVQQGWQNPLMPNVQPPAPPMQDAAAGVRELLRGYNVPQGVMDQIGGMLGGQPPAAPQSQARPRQVVSRQQRAAARQVGRRATATRQLPSAALPQSMAGVRWARQPDGAYLPAG